MQILKSSEKKEILRRLKEQYGIEKIPYLLVRFGREKIRAYSGTLSREELNILDKNLRIETCGLYFLHDYGQEIRLSLDALHLLRGQITKNIIILNKKQAEQWFKGQDIDIAADRGFKILKYKEDFIGCGKSTKTLIKNFMPKERRIKN